ncbi:MAG: 2-C-methyl-D-erythritol 4-phosphate cytidylyltransferase [Bacteroidales bacterium]|nr:2-C-methyl-D-erythritol 4-phosphate cytidylyltransferase [Bacteroidales bacterium]
MKAAIIVAGGTGSRMSSPTPKQFLLLKEIPVLMHPINAFFRFDPSIRILLALPESLFSEWVALLQRYNLTIPHELVPGGATRFHSVFNCLQRLAPEGMVAIHDGARPLVSQELLHRLFTLAEEKGNAVPVVPVTESIRELAGSSSRPSDRSLFRIVQTPQVFQTALIQEAYTQSYRSEFTDDATVLESTGIPICLASGDPINLKITFPSDLVTAEALMKSGK